MEKALIRVMVSLLSLKHLSGAPVYCSLLPLVLPHDVRLALVLGLQHGFRHVYTFMCPVPMMWGIHMVA